ncbi:MAG: hypothetical protein P8O86_00085 [Actinomycetota bacterium]|nr:hypothetical protein [Actinomycetota bacterium]MDG2120403.1 hypothetical protein [Actinomycetota bacterium]
MTQSSEQAIIDQVKYQQLSWACPCRGWDVEMLLNKMITSALLFSTLCRGETPEPDVNLLFPENVGGADASITFESASIDCFAAFDDSGLEGEMMGPLGETIPKSVGLLVRSLDATINTWDLAQAIDVETEIAAEQAVELISFAEGFLPKVRAQTDHVRFAPARNPTNTTDPLEKLVLLSGRNLNWF